VLAAGVQLQLVPPVKMMRRQCPEIIGAATYGHQTRERRITVRDLEAAIAFFTDLGLTVVGRGDL